MEKLNALNREFTKKLDIHVGIFKLIGSSKLESPIWFQLDASFDDVNGLIFRNSQKRNILFDVPCDKETLEWVKHHSTEAYDHFKRVKYLHLKEHHPDIFAHLDSFPMQKSNVNSFLKK